ncbi:MAG: Coenzyme F420 hydrogenase/dehydrogenase, beta subunit C-terminal domain, partial [Methanomicrobiales archaeon]
LAPKSTGYCKQTTDGVSCCACYAVCPRVWEPPTETLGNYLELACAKSTFEVPHKQSGGAVTAILANALDQGLIDAIVTVTEDRWTLKPSSVIITKSYVLVQQAGSRYSWWVPCLAALKHAVVERKFRRIAVIGVPCAVQAVGRMRESENDLVKPYGNAIRLVIGLFCTETFDYTALIQGKLRTDYKLEPYEIKKLDVKGKLDVLKHDGTTTIVPLIELKTCTRKGCHYCSDLTAGVSDISAGAIGCPTGTTTLIIRTPTGKGFIDSAVQNHKLTLAPDVDAAAIEKLASAKIKKNSKK